MKDLNSSYKLTNTLETAREGLANAIDYMQNLLDQMEYLEGLNDWDLTHALINEELDIQELELAIDDAQQALEYLEIAQDFAEEQEQAIKAMEASNEYARFCKSYNYFRNPIFKRWNSSNRSKRNNNAIIRERARARTYKTLK